MATPRRLTTVLISLFFFVLISLGQDPVSVEYTGKFETDLRPDMVHLYQRVFSSAEARLKYIPKLPANSSVFEGDLSDARTGGGKVRMGVVELPDGTLLCGVDVNGNGSIENAERYEVKTGKREREDLDITIHLPIDNGIFKKFPVFIRYLKGFKHPQLKPSDRLLMQTVWAHAYGQVAVNSKKVLFQYPFDPGSPTISTTEGLFGIDVDGDDKILDQQFSVETSYASKEEIVFRLGDKYLSTSTADNIKNLIIVRSRKREEYLRHEITVGKEMPDFSFLDLDGKPRKLSDLREKYVLVDFWGVWCVDCRKETPFHIRAYERFAKRGLEILSLNSDESVAVAQEYILKNKMNWVHARRDSILTLIEKTYRIQEYPTTVLLGPGAKVLILDQTLLRGSDLLETLDRTLPAIK